MTPPNQRFHMSLSCLLTLGGLMAVTSLSTDMYLPALPLMERDLGGQVEYTITGFLLGFALAQLVWGPISDRIGRKKVLYMGLCLFILGSLGLPGLLICPGSLSFVSYKPLVLVSVP